MAIAHHFSEKAQLLAFILQNSPDWDSDLLNVLETSWGKIRHLGKLFPFNRTTYYKNEMGEGLFRCVVSL